MADDRLDDAIDAVVRAVDRIERATRGKAPADPAAAPGGVMAADVQPPPVEVSPGRDAWGEVRPKKKHKKHKHKKRLPQLPPEAYVDYADDDQIDDDDAFSDLEGPEADAFAEADELAAVDDGYVQAPAPPSTMAPGTGVRSAMVGDRPDSRPFAGAPAHAPAEVHELVGRIVARTQELDEHLEAARELRVEITELVARLGAAATHQR